jgi:hypothetical protein
MGLVVSTPCLRPGDRVDPCRGSGDRVRTPVTAATTRLTRNVMFSPFATTATTAIAFETDLYRDKIAALTTYPDGNGLLL